MHIMLKLNQDLNKIAGAKLTRSQLAALQRYQDELLEWNGRFNLTAIRDVEAIRTKHFLDSLTCWIAMRNTPVNHIIDIGTWAGFPGIPLKILLPNLRLTLVDSVGKKVEFCKHIVKTLNLEGVEVLQGRAEEIGQDAQHREQYDWAVARAVTSLPSLVEYLLPLVKIGGHMLAQKGENGPAEAHSAQNAIHILGGQIHQLIPVVLPGVVEERYLVVVNKIAATPHQYPRRTGIPAKSPL